MRVLSAVVICIVPVLSGCRASGVCYGVPLSGVQRPELEQIVGVRLTNGKRVKFDGMGVVVMRDSIFSRIGQLTPFAVPVAQVRDLWIRNPRGILQPGRPVSCPGRSRFVGRR